MAPMTRAASNKAKKGIASPMIVETGPERPLAGLQEKRNSGVARIIAKTAAIATNISNRQPARIPSGPAKIQCSPVVAGADGIVAAAVDAGSEVSGGVVGGKRSVIEISAIRATR